MKILYLVVALILMLSESGVSQSISGNVQDINGNGVPLVNVFLHTVQDSTIVKATAADEHGNFSFDQNKYGDYLLSATLVGHKKVFAPVKFSEQTINQKVTLTIVEDPKTLGEVVVSGQRPFLEQRPDRLVVNVANSIVATGGTVLEVLEKSPGITIDHQNEILQFRGKSGVKILIDGKPTNLSDKDLFLLSRE